MTLLDRPVRGTRPANRRELILAAATELFATRGYEHVTISDVADAVAVGPSALYRHFARKEELLAHVIGDVTDRLIDLLDVPRSPDDLISAVVAFALDHRSAGVLWEREARHLPPDTTAAVRVRVRDARTRLTSVIHDARPTLAPEVAEYVSAAVLAAALSPSFHHATLPRPLYDVCLAQLMQRVLATELPSAPAGKAAERPPGLTRVSKRELLLSEAMRLFAERTYASVSMEDVAAAIGTSASTVYHHFPSKLDMLLTGLTRGSSYLQVTLEEVLAEAGSPAQALRGLVASYSRFAVTHPHLVDVLITEDRNLPDQEAATLRQTQRDYVNEWVHLLRQLHVDVDDTTGRVQVQAALMIVNNLARHPGIRQRPGADQILNALACSALEVP